jgi:hypothetical protein
MNTPLDLTLAYTDPDGPGSYTFTLNGLPTHGALSGSGANRRYTPAAGYTGLDSFRWHVNDGLANSAVVNFGLTVKSTTVNQSAEADHQDVHLGQDSSIEIRLDYSDPDGPGPYTIVLVKQPVKGTLTGTDNDRVYTPNSGFVGVDSFTWKVNDGRIDSNIALVSVQVAPKDPVPGETLLISDLSALSGDDYHVVNGGIKSGATVYSDRSYTYTDVPAVIEGAHYVVTANDDKARSESAFLNFSVNQDVTVYVAYDSRASALPGWLTGWANFGQTLGNTDVGLDLYSQDFVAGRITLGANLALGAAGARSNYVVLIVGHSTPAAGPMVISGLVVGSNKAYQVADDLSVGDLVYIDRSYTYTQVPAVIGGALHVNTANADKSQSGTSFLTFSVNQDVTVYVAYDSRATSLPAWLAGWSSTGSSLDNTDTLLDLYAKDFAAGSVTLGGNLAPGGAGASSNYSVAIVPR